MSMNVVIPTVETERLTLRAFRIEDFETYAAFFASDRACHVGGPKDRRGAWGDFTSDTAAWQLRGAGMWAVDHKETGALAGWVGIVETVFYEEPELGWMLTEAFEGQGLAREAALAARDYAREKLGLDGLVSFIEAGNTRSIRLAERLGATREETRDNGRGPFHVYRHPKGAA
ncbi:RimJ/RimL family protein N-acetyltransferase [Aliiruegeria haliotis]|uniref:RimJ/RimL family protein N-acetyltransferase n=1 Tax=Aliiruegeria haliotis TaxID=1280846 RepID=A0A2T0RRF5_9RHOB|nr:GNAT family N-acetyltransferase [Aliiruegeria haliotis]PRY23697.1 RimJ/RimL family protein N-acetyltransferase [Aliiruegeria haliotis]